MTRSTADIVAELRRMSPFSGDGARAHEAADRLEYYSVELHRLVMAVVRQDLAAAADDSDPTPPFGIERPDPQQIVVKA